MKTYQFNDFNVCTDPTWIYKRKGEKVQLHIGIATFKGYWEACLSFDTPYSGQGWLPSKSAMERRKRPFAEAVTHIIDYTNTVLDRTINDTNSCKPSYLDPILFDEKKRFQAWAKTLQAHNFSQEIVIRIEAHKQVKQGSLF